MESAKSFKSKQNVMIHSVENHRVINNFGLLICFLTPAGGLVILHGRKKKSEVYIEAKQLKLVQNLLYLLCSHKTDAAA